MILTVPYPCRIKGTLVGGSKSRLFRYWDTIEVRVDEIGAEELVLAAEMKLVKDDPEALTHRFHSIDGLVGLYRASAMPIDHLGHEVARAFGELDDKAEEILSGRPNLREVERDYSTTDAANLQRRMNEAFACGGVLYLPSAEPYLHVVVSPPAASVVQIEWLRRKNTDGNIRSFRLPDWEEALAYCGAQNGRVDHFKKRVSIEVFDPTPFRYDPANGEIVYATRMILEMHEHLLPRLSLDEATSWYNLRDAVEKWASDDAESPSTVIDLSRDALGRLSRYRRLGPLALAEITQTLDKAEAHFVVDEDLEQFVRRGPMV